MPDTMFHCISKYITPLRLPGLFTGTKLLVFCFLMSIMELTEIITNLTNMEDVEERVDRNMFLGAVN